MRPLDGRAGRGHCTQARQNLSLSGLWGPIFFVFPSFSCMRFQDLAALLKVSLQMLHTSSPTSRSNSIYITPPIPPCLLHILIISHPSTLTSPSVLGSCTYVLTLSATPTFNTRIDSCARVVMHICRLFNAVFFTASSVAFCILRKISQSILAAHEDSHFKESFGEDSVYSAWFLYETRF